MTSAFDAMIFATGAHKGHVRKYTGLPYIVHPAEVVGIVASVTHDDSMLQAAWLHDVVEDAGVTISEIQSRFGNHVATLVSWLSEAPTGTYGNRALRKGVEARRLEQATTQAKTIKLADVISNSRTIVQLDPKFAKVFLHEKLVSLQYLRGGDSLLWAMALKIITDGLTEIGETFEVPSPDVR
jgi:(p)ppGpp synthase/HD superfamily hydrolase